MNTSVNTAVRAAALKTKVGREVTGEVLRERALQSGTNTNTPSDWARAVSKLIKTGILSPTGKTITASSPQAHNRKVPIYIRNSARGVAA